MGYYIGKDWQPRGFLFNAMVGEKTFPSLGRDERLIEIVYMQWCDQLDRPSDGTISHQRVSSLYPLLLLFSLRATFRPSKLERDMH